MCLAQGIKEWAELKSCERFRVAGDINFLKYTTCIECLFFAGCHSRVSALSP